MAKTKTNTVDEVFSKAEYNKKAIVESPRALVKSVGRNMRV